MPPFPHDPLPLQQWLSHQPGELRVLLARAQQLADINKALQQWNSEPWLAQIHLANIRNDTLVIFSSSAAALVVLRNRQKALLDFINQRFHLTCTLIEAKVRPISNTQSHGV